MDDCFGKPCPSIKTEIKEEPESEENDIIINESTAETILGISVEQQNEGQEFKEDDTIDVKQEDVSQGETVEFEKKYGEPREVLVDVDNDKKAFLMKSDIFHCDGGNSNSRSKDVHFYNDAQETILGMCEHEQQTKGQKFKQEHEEESDESFDIEIEDFDEEDTSELEENDSDEILVDVDSDNENFFNGTYRYYYDSANNAIGNARYSHDSRLGGISTRSSANGDTFSPGILVPSSQQGLAVLCSASTMGATSPVMPQTAQGVVHQVPNPSAAIPKRVVLKLGPSLAAHHGTSSIKEPQKNILGSNSEVVHNVQRKLQNSEEDSDESVDTKILDISEEEKVTSKSEGENNGSGEVLVDLDSDNENFPNNSGNFDKYPQKKSAQCDTSGKYVVSMSNPSTHKNTERKPYVCVTRGKSVTHLLSLSLHEHIHAGTTFYFCPCGKKFTSKLGLKSHGRVHTKKKDVS